MDYIFMTPTQVWEGYDPADEPLDLVVTREIKDDGLAISDFTFTADNSDAGKIRGFGRFYGLLEWGDEKVQRPAVLYLPPVRPIYHKNLIMSMLEKGYVVATVDYAGEDEGKENYTVYPRALDYGNYLRAGTHLEQVQTSSRDTSWFLWAKIAMRGLTALAQQSTVDENRLAIVGVEEGAQIVWQVAGVDARLKAAIPILGAGNLEYKGKFRYASDNKLEMNDERNAWLAGSAPQTYAQTAVCPVYLLTATNSSYVDFDRAFDTVHKVKHDDALMVVTPKANRQVSERSLTAALAWLSQIFDGTYQRHPEPELQYVNREGRLFVEVHAEGEIEKIKVYVSQGEIDPTARSWEKLIKNAFTGDDDYLFEIPVYDTDQRVFVFANVFFADGVVATGNLVTLIPEDEGITAEEKSTQYDRIIYSGTMRGASGFSAENEPMHLESGVIDLTEGPGGLVGIIAKKGTLVTYKLKESDFAKNKHSLFQFSAYSAVEKVVKLNLYITDSDEVYYTEVKIVGAESWQRFTFGVGDFKTEQRHALKEWSEIRKLEIENSEGVLFNNFLWL